MSPAVRKARNQLAKQILMTIIRTDIGIEADVAATRSIAFADAFVAKCRQDGNTADIETYGDEDAQDTPAVE